MGNRDPLKKEARALDSERPRSCGGFLSRLKDYLNDDLDESERQQLEAHRDECPDCRSVLDRAYEIECREVIEFVGDYLENELPPESRLLFERHLDICPDCVNYLESYGRTRELTRQLGRVDPAPPLPLPETLIRAVLDSRRGIPPKRV